MSTKNQRGGSNNFQRYGVRGRRGRGGAFNGNNNSRDVGQHTGARGDNMQRSGNWNYKRTYNNDNAAYNAEEGFSKFRDPQQHQRQYNNMRHQHHSGYRGSNASGAGGDCNEKSKTGAKNNFENKAMFGQLPTATNMQTELEAVTSTPTSTPNNTTAVAKTSSSAAENQVATVATPVTGGSPTVPNETLEDKKPLLHKIKKEKKDTKPSSPAPSSSSTSSSESSSSSSASKIDMKTVKEAPKPSSSSSSEESESSSDEEENNPAPFVPEKHTKAAKEKSKRKQSSEEDLVCLGKLEKNYVIEDEEENAEAANEVDRSKNECILCDKHGHTAFQCQMICKNCAAPYHNHKNCPHPPNLTVMMQSFMEFCMTQMGQYQPEQQFAFTPTVCMNDSVGTIPTIVSTSLAPPTKRKQRKKEKKVKANEKKSTKRKRHSTESDDEDTDTDTSTDSSESDVHSAHSAKASTGSKSKVRAQKLSTPQAYRNTLAAHGSVPTPFTTFPAFGAAAAAYNPLLLSQMLHGAFVPPTNLNYK